MRDSFLTKFSFLLTLAATVIAIWIPERIEIRGFCVLIVIGLGSLGVYLLQRCRAESRARRLTQMRKSFRNAMVSINSTSPDARVIDLLDREPDILVPFDPDTSIDYRALLARFNVDGRKGLSAISSERNRLPPDSNRTHAILFESFTPNMPSVTGLAADYAFVLGYEAVVGEKPRRLSASGLLVHAGRKCLLLHRRATGPRGGRYPGKLHIIGGNFEPGRETRASQTLVRETSEESSHVLHLGTELDQAVCMLAEETNTGFQAVTFLGIEPSDDEVRHIMISGGAPATSEGQVVPVQIAELGHLLARIEEWVPSGRQAVLSWLAIGAPANGSSMLNPDEITQILRIAGVSLSN